MSKFNPSKRKPIRENIHLDEIKDNVKNHAIVTRSKTQERLNKEVIEDQSNENDSSAGSSNNEEILNDVRTKSTPNSDKYEIHARLRNRQENNTSRDNNRLDSGPSSSRDPFKSTEPKSAINNSKSQLIDKGKSNYSPVSRNTRNIVKPICNVTGHNCFSLSGAILIICLVFVIYSYVFVPASMKNVNIKCGKDDVNCITDNVKRTLKTLQSKYINQDVDLWRNVYIGIKNIIHDPTKPFIIVLLGNGTDPLSCLSVLLGDVSSKALNSNLLKLTPEKFDNDTGSVIKSLRQSIKDKKAVIIWDLLNINEEALKSFHNLCDRHNPLVEEVIYIITIIAKDYDKKIDPLQFIEQKLHKKLSGKIKNDAIQPLITRITDGPILTVKPEPDMIGCPFPKI